MTSLLVVSAKGAMVEGVAVSLEVEHHQGSVETVPSAPFGGRSKPKASKQLVAGERTLQTSSAEPSKGVVISSVAF